MGNKFAPKLVLTLIISTWIQGGQGVPPLRSELLGAFGGGSHSFPIENEDAPVDPNLHRVIPSSSDSFGLDEFDQEIPYRLPVQVTPIHYDWEIRPILDEATGVGRRFTAPGKIKIEVKALIQTSNITLHAEALNITQSSVKVTDVSGTSIPVTSQTYYKNASFFIIGLGGLGLQGGQTYFIHLEYVAPIPKDRLNGLYLSSYLDASGNPRYLAVTKFEPVDARRAFPCFDEPALKATWTITVLRQAGYHSLSNTKLEKSEPLEGNPGWFKDVYIKTIPMSTYLVAIAVSDFKSEMAKPDIFQGKPVGVWGPPGIMDLGAGKYSPDLCAKILAYLQEYYNIPYELPKMDSVSVPDFLSGAMENWGLNTYRESRLLWLNGVSTIEDKTNLVLTVAHELAHQWFGNHVTMEWWNDIWLNEGFASYVEMKAALAVAPEFIPDQVFLYDSVQRGMQGDAGPTPHPLSPPSATINSEAKIRGLFSGITYAKGSAILRMVEAFLTEPTFKRGLNEYLKEKYFDSAKQDDLFQILQKEAVKDGSLPEGLTVKMILDTWTLKSGYPIVRVSRDSGVNKLKISQEKYFSTGPPKDNPNKETWTIPITYIKEISRSEVNTTTTEAGQLDLKTKYWFRAEKTTDEFDAEVGDTNKWIVVNPTSIGFYRVMYSDADFKVLTEQLKKDHKVIDPQSRSALIDDAMNLGFAGYMEVGKALGLTEYLSNERELVPWITFFTNMGVPYRFFGRSSVFINFKGYIQSLIKAPLNDLGFEQEENEALSTTRLRTRLVEWACNLNDGSCVQFATSAFKKWMETPGTNPIFPDLRQTVYCTAMAKGGDQAWNFLIKQYEVTPGTSPSKYLIDSAQISIVRGLACSTETYRLAKLLDLAIDPNSFLLKQHALTAWQGVTGNTVGTKLAFHFIRNNFDIILQRFGQQFIANVVTALSNNLRDKIELSDLENFIKSKESELKDVKVSLEGSLERVRSNLAWMERNHRGFKSWLGSTLNMNKIMDK